jgi:hypothetical protein
MIFVCADTIFESGIGEIYRIVVVLEAPVKKKSALTAMINPKNRFVFFDKTEMAAFKENLGT